MPYVRTRCGVDEQPRYTAYFHDARGRERSAGTYPLLREAHEAAFDAQARVLDGRFLDRAVGRSTFEHYATETWLPNLTFEATTRQGYAYVVHKYLLKYFGPIRMSELMPGTVREFYALLSAAGVGTPTLHKCKTVLCSIFNTAVNDRIVARHPCASIPVPPDPLRLRKVISPTQYLDIRTHLPERWQLLADLAPGTDLVARLAAMIEDRGTSPQDLLFPATRLQPVRAKPETQPGDFTRGGRHFTHGTLYAYTVGTCRCDPCRAAFTTYRADRRTHGLDRPTYRLPATPSTELRHLSRDWFRNRVWQPAVTAADIGQPVTVHDLRHAAASWSLAGGATSKKSAKCSDTPPSEPSNTTSTPSQAPPTAPPSKPTTEPDRHGQKAPDTATGAAKAHGP